MLKKISSGICVLIFPLFVFGQPENETTQTTEEVELTDYQRIKQIEDTLGVLSHAIINDSLAENRFGSCHKFIPTLVKALKIENSFDYKFDRLKSISIQYPKDSTFRIFTWQLFVSDEEYRYFGAIQMNSSELKLFPLADRSFDIMNPEQQSLPPNHWYGAVYYNLKQFESPTGPQYLLFGFDGFSFFNRRKVVDVLSFENGEPIFGSPVILKHDARTQRAVAVKRLVLEYSAASSVRLNYDEALGHIMHDHLILMADSRGEPAFVPDGSYEGYALEKGYWMNIDKVYNQVSEEAPRNQPILKEGNDKNIFGKQGKKKNRIN